MNVGKMQIKGVTVETSHGSPLMKRNSKLQSETKTLETLWKILLPFVFPLPFAMLL